MSILVPSEAVGLARAVAGRDEDRRGIAAVRGLQRHIARVSVG